MDSGTATTADSGTVTRRDGGTATKVIGAEGGTLESSEANAKLVVPRGALSSQVSLTIRPAPAAPEGALKAIEIGPSGTKFQTAATVIISYEGMSLGGMDAANLRVATVSGGMWVALEGSTVDERTKEAKGNTTHLSPFGLIGV